MSHDNASVLDMPKRLLLRHLILRRSSTYSKEGEHQGLQHGCRKVEASEFERLELALSQLELKVKFSDGYASLLRHYGDAKALSHGKRVHDHIVSSGHAANGYLRNLLVEMYGKCGDLQTARVVFDELPRKNVVLWNIMLGAYDRNGHGREALDLYGKMDSEGVQPDRITLITILRVCVGLRALAEGRTIHKQVVGSRFQHEIKVQNALINMYAKCGSLDAAKELFDRLENKDVVSWNSIVTAYAQVGHPSETLVLYQRMQLEGGQPDGITFSSVLSACRAREDVKSIHTCIMVSEFHSDVVVQNALMAAYAKCASLDLGRAVFDKMLKKDLISWNSMIAAYAQQGHAEETLDLYQKMDADRVEPDSITFASVLGACCYVGAIDFGKAVHARILKSRFKSSVIVETALVNMYCKCGMVDAAKSVFDNLDSHSKNVSPWNAMIAGYVQHGRAREALDLYGKMDSENVSPDRITFTSVLGACCCLEALDEGSSVHERVIACGYESDMVVETALFNMYSKCGRLDVARRMFDKMQQKNVVSWNVMIATYAQRGHILQAREALDLYGLMDSEGVQPDDITYIHVLSACATLGAVEEGKAVHARVLASGCQSSVVLETAIVSMYAKCNLLNVARSEFDKMQVKTVVSWNAMIAAYAQHGHSRESIRLYEQMNLEGVEPDGSTFVSVLGACSNLEALHKGKIIHAQVIAAGYNAVETALVNMYAKCGELEVARNMFDKLQHRTLVSWNTMIVAYAQHGYGKAALDLYESMEVQPDSITFAGALGACVTFGGSEKGAEIHASILASRIELDVVLETAIVNMYGKCGNLDIARSIFDRMQVKNVITWTALVTAYIQHAHDREALDLYLKMDSEGVQPNEVTFVGILAACSRLGAVQVGKAVHACINASSSISLALQNALINMYAKCGWLSVAKKMFERMTQTRDSLSWNAIIGGYAQHGDAKEVLDLHKEMELEGVQPDSVTLTCILLACSHAGLLEEGRNCFISMAAEHGVAADAEHYVCMVDLLARAGRLESAEQLINSMPFEPYALAWTSLLGSCTVQGDKARGLRYAGNVAMLDPKNTAPYIALSNIYTTGARENSKV